MPANRSAVGLVSRDTLIHGVVNCLVTHAAELIRHLPQGLFHVGQVGAGRQVEPLCDLLQAIVETVRDDILECTPLL